MRKFCALLSYAAGAAVALGVSASSSAAIVKTTADTQLNEINDSQSSAGIATSLNSRTNGALQNEVMAFRFDLTSALGSDPMSAIAGATFTLTNFRDNTTRTIEAYGVADGTLGNDNNGQTPGFDDNNWNETATTLRWSTMPGLVYDGNTTTAGIHASATNLGSFALSAASLKGTTNTFSDPAITAFLNSHPDTIVTILVRTITSSSGQARMASREATALDAGTPTGAAGDFAAVLTFQVPEPSSLSALGLGALAMLRRRRRA
jgi:hypothetical protein